MPPRFTPFSNSLMQGMQNTNKNIGRMNMPPNQINVTKQPNYLNPQFNYGVGNQGGGFLGGGQGNIGGEYGGMTNIVDTETGGPNIDPVGPDYDPNPDMEINEFDLNQDGIVNQQDFVYGQVQGVNMGLLEALYNYLTQGQDMFQQPETLTQFAGGGGQGGQAAKRLYYPGTSGGFAGVGSGIGGANTLQELLKQYQG